MKDYKEARECFYETYHKDYVELVKLAEKARMGNSNPSVMSQIVDGAWDFMQVKSLATAMRSLIWFAKHIDLITREEAKMLMQHVYDIEGRMLL